ncbi:MAG TPA: alpha/beta-hydrolase family protein, partial [Acidimicrobiia bacterium]|nr:alpha/beta-hydrolase family protein [Acidimicrobiia bacterium]
SMKWVPAITFIQTLIDAANAMVTVPGEFLSFGHDYRADTARMVQAAYQLPPVTAEQMERVEAKLRELELDRAGRIKAATADVAPPAPAQMTVEGVIAGVPMRQPRAQGANWRNNQLFARLKRKEGTVQ